MADSSSHLATGYGRIIFSPATRLSNGAYYLGPVLIMLINPDVRITALVAWATSVKRGPLSAIILLTTPETEPYTRLLDGMLEEVLSPLEISIQKLAIPGTYDHDEARYNYLFNLFYGYLAEVTDRIIVDLTTGPNTIARQLHEAASNAGVKEFQTVKGPETLINVPPFDRLREGVDYEIRRVSEVERAESESSDANQKGRLVITEDRNSVTENKSAEVRPDVLPHIAAEANPARQARVFVSYSHSDKKWLTELQTMLKPLVHNNAIDLWDDTKIQPGAIWKHEIEKALASSKVAVLLVSANFLASDFITKNELPPLLSAARGKGPTIFWIYISSCLYKQTEIAKYQAAHDVSRPLDRMTKANRQAVLSEVYTLIKNHLD
jgi:TIR domain